MVVQRFTRRELERASVFFLTLLWATDFAKLAYLQQVYSRNVSSFLDEMIAAAATPVSRPIATALVLAADVWQCALATSVVVAATQLVSAANGAVLRRVALGLALLFFAANQLAFTELGGFASFGTLRTAAAWVLREPRALSTHLTLASLLVAAGGVGVALIPDLVEQLAARAPRVDRVLGRLPLACALLVATSLAVTPLASARFGRDAFPIQGYFSRFATEALARERRDPLALPVPDAASVVEEGARLAFPLGEPAGPRWLLPGLDARLRPRHVLVVGLETAARAFYPITNSSSLPTFARMTERAVVSDRHYTTSPYTRIANFSILSGLYAPPEGLPTRLGPIRTDGLAAVLRDHGYETTYVDSWVLDWEPGSGERDTARMLGFDHVTDGDERRDDGVYEVLVPAEAAAFDKAFSAIDAARSHGRHAAVFVGTMLGHAPWPAAANDQHATSTERLHRIQLVFDGLFARLLDRLGSIGLGDEVIIVVTGDHGLRLQDEFASVNLSYSHSDHSYNVPLLLHAPGIFDRTFQLPHATSHVDITPTVLHLLGLSRPGLLHDGGNMLDASLGDRTTYLSSSNLGPLDGFRHRDAWVTFHRLSGVARIGRGDDVASMLPLERSGLLGELPAPLRDPAAALDAFALHTERTAALLLARGRGGADAAERPRTPEAAPR